MLSEKFFQTYGRSHSVHSYAPGRVNLIGEHTDYNQGFVFPVAINFATQVLAAPRDDRQVHILALDINTERDQFSLDDIQHSEDKLWSNYVRGVLQVLQNEKGPLRGMDLLVTGNVPQGAGLSSSASFEVALLKAVSELYAIPLGGVEAALLGQRAENDFVGCACGIMDQLISASGRQGQAMLLDCRSLEAQFTPVSDALRIVIINSNVKRGLVDSEYNARREQCESAAKVMGVSSLRDADEAMLARFRDQLTEVEFRRARHVITENQRTLDFLGALGRDDMANVSELMRASHQSMRDDFDITVPPIDYLVELIHGIIGHQGGVRMTGGGFGGCVVALCPVALVEQVQEAVRKHYPTETGLSADVYVCSAENGAFS